MCMNYFYFLNGHFFAILQKWPICLVDKGSFQINHILQEQVSQAMCKLDFIVLTAVSCICFPLNSDFPLYPNDIKWPRFIEYHEVRYMCPGM